jgi:alkaline phosphatase D
MFVQIGMTPSLSGGLQIGSNFLLPGFLGGGKAKYKILIAKASVEDLNQLGVWLAGGKIQSVLDSEFKWEDAPEAYTRLKTGRAKGKIVVHVPQEST